jgi:uncharacterized protein (TIRG00374 family)
MRTLRSILLVAGIVALVALVHHFGTGSITSALASVTWWQFVVICAVHGVSVVADTLGWRYTFGAHRPAFHRLLAAKCAGEAVNVLTALGSVGGEATKAWLLRREISYQASVPSLVLAKTTLIVGQALLLVLGIVVAWATGIGGPTLRIAMAWLLLVEVVGIGGFILVQNVGMVGKAGRILSWVGGRGVKRAAWFDDALRGFYRSEWRLLLLSVAAHFLGWLIGTLEAFVILTSLALPASLATASVIEALGSGVRFATFLVPASLGTLEGANSAAFTAFGWSAGAGLAFTLVRRGRQAVWIGLGLVLLLALGTTRAPAKEAAEPLPSGAD